jgi:hypothetical protein
MPLILSELKEKEINSGRKTKIIPDNPRTPPIMTRISKGVLRKIAPLIMFMSRIVEKMTAARPLVRCNSAR